MYEYAVELVVKRARDEYPNFFSSVTALISKCSCNSSSMLACCAVLYVPCCTVLYHANANANANAA